MAQLCPKPTTAMFTPKLNLLAHLSSLPLSYAFWVLHSAPPSSSLQMLYVSAKHSSPPPTVRWLPTFAPLLYTFTLLKQNHHWKPHMSKPTSRTTTSKSIVANSKRLLKKQRKKERKQ